MHYHLGATVSHHVLNNYMVSMVHRGKNRFHGLFLHELNYFFASRHRGYSTILTDLSTGNLVNTIFKLHITSIVTYPRMGVH